MSLANKIPDDQWWAKCFSNVMPIGYDLRRAFPDRWCRIHSLPEKRYAENQEDWDTLHQRHRYSTSHLFHEDEPCYLFTPWSCASDACFKAFQLHAAPTIPGFRPDLDAQPTGPFHAALFNWSFDKITPVLNAAAEWKSLVTFISADGTRVYAPYDGGADFILPTESDRNTYREAVKKYLSPLPSGL